MAAPDQDNKQPNSGRNNSSLMYFLFLSLLFTFFINMLSSSIADNSYEKITYNEFIDMVENGSVLSVEIQEDRLIIEPTDQPEEEAEDSAVPGVISGQRKEKGKTYYYTGNIQDSELIPRLEDNNVEYWGQIQTSNPIMEFVMSWVFPIMFIYGITTLLMRSFAKKMGGGRGGFMGMGQSNAKMYDMEKKTGVKFEDVAGQEEAKESLNEIVDFLHYPEKYTNIGAKQPKGALLVGPPGTGKTLLAKAVAGEANVTFFSLSGSDFVEMFVGLGASRVRDLFKQASEHAPCIVFIDEIDAIGKSRDNQLGSNDEREQTLNQLLSEMDGFDSSKGVVILAATNRPEVLDKALLRPGRFDRRIVVEKPDLKGREAILEVHAKNVKLGDDVDLHGIALATSGAAGADLANMVNEAALRAVRMNRDYIIQEDLMEAVEVIIAGKEKKDRILGKKEKELVAYHEIGHALVSALQKNSQPVQKITIVPRTMGALGYTMTVPEEERYLMTQEEILNQIAMMLGGRAAEEVQFDIKTTGASDDIKKATKLARSMVSMYGMSEKFGMMGLENVENQYLDGRNVANCSEATAYELDQEVIKILEDCYRKAIALLSENKESLVRLSEFLIEKETIQGEQFMEILKELKGESWIAPEADESKL